MYYHSTRNSKLKKTFDEIIIEGLSSDGGLFMPRSWPKVKIENLLNRDDLSYDILAKEIIQNYVGDTINKKELELITKKSYSNFSHEKIAPIKKIEENKFILELFYGPTFAFKDYPLQLVGNLFQYYLTKKNKNITVIGATSGDTGSAAIEACRDKENIKIFILHPSMKTSDIQRKQMTTVMSENVYNIAVEGTFDDCQKIVKDLFVSNKLKNETTLSAINSINWARIISQTVYFFWAYIQAKKFDKKVNYIVPTGNFGNVYAAHVAGIMGLPINKLYVTTNENDIMHRTLSDGDMSLKNVKSTISPSMDIQISSNFERQLFESLDSNSNDLNNLMKEFYENSAGRSYKLVQCINESLDDGSDASGSSGTAFFINNKGYLLTNNHVVEGCSLSKITYKNKDYETKLIATDQTLDLALLKAEIKPKSYFAFAKDEAKKLNKVYVAGYPLGKGLSDDLKISSGIVSLFSPSPILYSWFLKLTYQVTPGIRSPGVSCVTLTSIIDANVTTFIAAVILFTLGSGPIKGFSVTLGIGIMTSVFTAVYLTRLLISIYFGFKKPKILNL